MLRLLSTVLTCLIVCQPTLVLAKAKTAPVAKAAPAKAAPAPDDRRLRGADTSKIVGFYDNPSWGKMLIEVDGDKFFGTYSYRFGTVKGKLNKTTGVVDAVWCEADSETDTKRPYRGLAQYVFEKGDGQKVNLKGKWKPGDAASTPWQEDWNLTKMTGKAPDELRARMNKKSSVPPFCDKVAL